MIKVTKRDQKKCEVFNKEKIAKACEKAMKDVGFSNIEKADQIAENVYAGLMRDGIEQISVYGIERRVEDKLMTLSHDVARAYIEFRHGKALKREAVKRNREVFELLNDTNDDITKENSNKNAALLCTKRDYMAGIQSKEIAEKILFDKDLIDAHKNGIIHIHDMDYIAMQMHNCFCRTTRFVTDEGVKSFEDFNDGEEVKVFSLDGEWHQATVHCYGKKEMQKVTFKCLNSTKEVICTPNHRWILADGTVTTELKPGMTLAQLPLYDIEMPKTKKQCKAFALGFIIGDGFDRANFVEARLCGEKNKYADIFKKAGYHITYPDLDNGDARVRKSSNSKQAFLNGKCWQYLDFEDKQYLFLGLYAADGRNSDTEYANRFISSSDERTVEMICDISATAGYHVSSVKKEIHDTAYKKGAILYTVRFRRRQNSNGNYWSIAKIQKYNDREAWCVEEPVTHSFTLDGGMVTGNCDVWNLNDMLQNGTVMNGTSIVKPKSLATAVTLTTQIVLQIAANQYGGQTFSVAHLAPFVRISYEKHKKEVKAEGRKAGIEYTAEQIEKIAKSRLDKEVKDAVQTLQYQLISCAVTNGQAPFVSVFMWINENPEYRDETVMLIKEILKQRKAGIPNKQGVPVTIAFPKLLYVLDETNTYEGQPYFWLTRDYAVPCTIERMVPDYISAKKMREYKNGDVFGCMGCVSKDEVISYRLYGKTYVESFRRAWNRLSEYCTVKTQPNGLDLYMDLSDVEIYDSRKGEFVKCLRIIRNHSTEWEKLTFSNGRAITVTPDHPFETENRGVVHACNLTVDDVILSQKSAAGLPENAEMDTDKAWFYGFMLCDSTYAESMVASIGMDESDIEQKFISVVGEKFGISVNVKEQHRGLKGNYKDLCLKSDSGYKDEKLVSLRCRLISLFEGIAKADRHIPNEVFEWSRDAKYAFMAGMIDADGYINGTGRMSPVQIGSTNKELALQQMLLAQELGMKASVYANHYRNNSKDNIRYRVEFYPDEKLVKMLCSQKKRNNFKNVSRKNDSLSTRDEISLLRREHFSDDAFSYDVSTESEHFSVSGIYSHNCRSFLTPDDFSDRVGNVAKAKDYVPGSKKYYGRFNQGVCTLNLPDVALSAQGNQEEFWKLMEERSELVHRVLQTRHKTLLGTKSDVAPILWQYGALARLKPGEVIDPLLYDGYSTISFGYVGLYECTMAMTGHSHTDPEGRKFAESVMQFINDKCVEWRANENIAYSPYGTPEENSVQKFSSCLKKRFGVIRGITDHDYVTNSYHVNPAEHIDAFSKLRLEGEFQKFSQGGCISYVELPSMKKNPEAVLKVVQCIYENTMYAEINLKLDYCQKCGFTGEMILRDDDQFCCPNCGNTDYNTMNITRRVCGYLSTNWPVSHSRFSDIRARVLHLEDESMNTD